MKTGFSIWLDALRVIATLAVVFSHLAYPRFTDGRYIWVRDLNLGSDAVILFFVLSGCLIAYAAERDQSLGKFAFNRLTRLWSVLIPALILTFVFDRVGVRIDGSAYPAQFYHEHSFANVLLRGATFSNEYTLLGRMRLGTNGPLWSLSYEAAYYALFAIAFYLRGTRRIALLVISPFIVGPGVLLLMPSWLLGVWVWRLVKTPAFSFPTGIAIACAVCPLFLYSAALWGGLPQSLLAFTTTGLGIVSPSRSLGFSNEFIWNALIGILVSVHLIGMSRLWRETTAKASVVRWAAGASFSVYVTHYPALHLGDAILPAALPGRDLILLGFVLGVGIIFAAAFERRLRDMRTALSAVLRRLGSERKNQPS